MRFSTQQLVDSLRREYRWVVASPLRAPSFTYKRVELTRQLARMKTLGVRDPVWDINAKDDAYEWARALGVRVPERLGGYDRITDVVWDALPDGVVLKPVNGVSSRGVYLLRRRGTTSWLELGSGHLVTGGDVVREYEELVDAGLVSPDVQAEELVTDPRYPDLPPVDYKAYCFYGTVGMIKVKGHSVSRAGGASAWRQFDTEWRDIGNAFHHYVMDRTIPPPVHRDELLAMAATISAAIPRPFVRVDLYDGEDGPVFGEITPMPGDKTIVTPRIDRMLGELWEDAEARLKVEIVRTGALNPRVPAAADGVAASVDTARSSAARRLRSVPSSTQVLDDGPAEASAV